MNPYVSLGLSGSDLSAQSFGSDLHLHRPAGLPDALFAVVPREYHNIERITQIFGKRSGQAVACHGSEVIASAPGRICLAGESLDWMIGGPSIVAAINLRTYVLAEQRTVPAHLLAAGHPYYLEKEIYTKDFCCYQNDNLQFLQAALNMSGCADKSKGGIALHSYSDLPTKAGVSSSAAVLNASLAALQSLCHRAPALLDVCRQSFSAERDHLRTGAGQMDFYACGVGGINYLNCKDEPPATVEPAKLEGVRVVLIDTCAPHSTKTFTSSKRARWAARDTKTIRYSEELPPIVEELRALLHSDKNALVEIGACLTRCHTMLRDLMECSTPLLDECVKVALSQGAFGAKLTGSGMGGCMFALADDESSQHIVAALSGLPVRVAITEISMQGTCEHKSAVSWSPGH